MRFSLSKTMVPGWAILTTCLFRSTRRSRPVAESVSCFRGRSPKHMGARLNSSTARTKKAARQGLCFRVASLWGTDNHQETDAKSPLRCSFADTPPLKPDTNRFPCKTARSSKPLPSHDFAHRVNFGRRPCATRPAESIGQTCFGNNKVKRSWDPSQLLLERQGKSNTGLRRSMQLNVVDQTVNLNDESIANNHRCSLAHPTLRWLRVL